MNGGRTVGLIATARPRSTVPDGPDETEYEKKSQPLREDDIAEEFVLPKGDNLDYTGYGCDQQENSDILIAVNGGVSRPPGWDI